MVKKQVTSKATRSNPGIQTTRIPAPTSEEQQSLFTSISGSTAKPAVLSLVTPFNEQYTYKEIDDVPKTLPDSLFKEECIQLDYTELLQQCQQISLEVTPDECQAIETSTRKQSQSKVWYQQRAGHITASKLKSACKTNTAKPAKSLVKSICYLEAHKFSTAATRWSCEHEGGARKAYQIEINRFH